MMRLLFISTAKTDGIFLGKHAHSMTVLDRSLFHIQGGREMSKEKKKKKCSLLVKYDWNPVWQEK